MDHVTRRQSITLIVGAVGWPLSTGAQQPLVPVVGFVSSRSLDGATRQAAAFSKGLSEAGRGDRMSTRREFITLLGGAAAWPLVGATRLAATSQNVDVSGSTAIDP
jgi:hypothetical protein